MMNKKQKPVIILTGFLGSGKTTLLNTILKNKPKTRFAIIENEVGETGIDGELIIKNTDSFTELSNGCICCSLNDNFTDTLKDLSKREDWDELIIEATGVANPGGILSPFKQFPWIQKYFEMPLVICIADAQNIKEQFKISDVAGAQLAYADNVYINKTDLVAETEWAEIKRLIQGFNPFAHLVLGNKNNTPLKELLLKKTVVRPVIQINSNISNNTENHFKHDLFDAISLEYEESFDEKKVFSRLYTFLMFQSDYVYRFKAIFYDDQNKHKMIAQSVMKSLYIKEGEDWAKDEQKISKFVFIGKNLKSKGFDKMLRSCMR